MLEDNATALAKPEAATGVNAVIGGPGPVVHTVNFSWQRLVRATQPVAVPPAPYLP